MSYKVEDGPSRISLRKRAGWIMGSFGVISLFISIVGIAGMSIISKIFFDLTEFAAREPGDPMPAVVMSYLFYISSGLVILFIFASLISILKIITGIMVHRGKKRGPVLVLICIGIPLSFINMTLFLLISMALLSIIGVSFFFIIILEIAVWGYLIHALARTFQTFDQRPGKIGQSLTT